MGLWISSIKINEKRGVRKIPKARRVISHGVKRSRQVVLEGQVAMKPLVQGTLPEQRGGGRGCCDGAFAVPEERGKVIGVGL